MLFDLWAEPEGEAYLKEILEGAACPWEVLAGLDRLAQLLPEGITMADGVNIDGAHVLAQRVFLDRGAVLEPGAVLLGQGIYLGPGAVARAGAYLRGPVYVGAGGVVGHATEAKRALFFPNARAPHFNYVGDSVLGWEVNLGACTKLSNLRLDEREIKATWSGRRRPTGLTKLGALLGDGCSLGCNTVTNPGTVLAPLTRVPPLTVVGGGRLPT